MSKQANPTTIGAFVIGAVFLTVAGVITFGKSKLFTEEQTFVAYFDSSVAGLDIGSPVEVQGVRVGSVCGVKGVIDPGTLEIKVPVYLNLEPGALGTTRELTEEEERVTLERTLQLMIEKGMRAELKKQSLVTGKLYVDLVFVSDSPAHFHGDPEFSEIPTVRGGLERLTKNIEEIDFEGLVNETTRAVQAVEELVGNPEIAELIHNLNELVKNLDAELGPLSESSRSVLAHADTLLTSSNTEISEVSQAAVDALQSLSSIERTYTVMRKTTVLLDEVAAAARSIRILAEYLERHPEALIKGKN